MQTRSPANALSDVCGATACAIGASVLLDWPGRIDAIHRLLGPGPSIRPATAASVLVLGVLLIVARRINLGTFRGITRTVLATALLGVSGLAFVRLRMLVDRVGEATRPVSPHTVGSLLLIGIAILLAVKADTNRRRLSIVVALAGAVAPWLALLGYTNGASMFYTVPNDPATGMAAMAAVALLLLSLGVMGLFPDHGFVALASAETEGGTLMRVMLPTALVFPLVLGAALHHGQTSGWFQPDVALAVNLGVTSSVIIALVLWIGIIFKRREAEQRAAEEEREILVQSLKTSLDELSKLQNNLVTVCAWTQRVLDEGKWVRFEEFLDKRLNISVSHGISEDAAKEELQNLEDWMAAPPENNEHNEDNEDYDEDNDEDDADDVLKH